MTVLEQKFYETMIWTMNEILQELKKMNMLSEELKNDKKVRHQNENNQ